MTAPLPEEKVAALAEALCDRYRRGYGNHGIEHPCVGHIKDAQALAPLVAGWLAEAWERHRDLTSRLGFGDNITEPQADNDTIVAWFEEQGRDAKEWVDSQLWRNDCYAKGHPDDDDCFECDPAFAYERGLAEGEARAKCPLTEHDGSHGPLIRQVKAEALREAADDRTLPTHAPPMIRQWLRDRAATLHDCESCPDCLHDGRKCCGCYDGACCQDSRGDA